MTLTCVWVESTQEAIKVCTGQFLSNFKPRQLLEEGISVEELPPSS